MPDGLACEVKACRLCGSKRLESVLSLGNQHVSDFVASDGQTPRAPLELVRCLGCGLIQLKHTFSRGSLYERYWYKSGISPTMRNALSELVLKTCEIAKPRAGDIVVDIGCNDGNLLRSYAIPGIYLVGFEPAGNLINEASRGTNKIFNDFFNAKTFRNDLGDRKAKVVSSVAMFYDLEDPNRFVNDVNDILADDGVWVIQQNYLGAMVENNGFDNIGHEHLEYYSLDTMQRLLDRHNLEIFEVETNEVNGGSFRTFACHKGRYPLSGSISALRKREAQLKLTDPSTYKTFAANIESIKSKLHSFVEQEVRRGNTVYVYGASNRGNTILQYCGLDHRLIKKATDANPDKWGRRTAGTGIPIVSKKDALANKPDYFLILPHHFAEEIIRDERNYLDNGGKFILPLPKVRLVTKDKTMEL